MLQQVQINLKVLQGQKVQYRRIVLAVHNLDELETFIEDAWSFTAELLDLSYCPLIASVN